MQPNLYPASLILSATLALGAMYEANWYTMDCGGTISSTGDTYELAGTIGQPDAGPVLTGGNFELTGGFWYAPAGGTTGCRCGDISGGGGDVDLLDFATFAVCYGLDNPQPPACDAHTFACSDLSGDGTVNLLDFATFATWYGESTTRTAPDCQHE